MELLTNFISIHRNKLENYQQRAKAAIIQLHDEDVNWRPNDESNSIVNIAIHLRGNLLQRFLVNLRGETDIRDRDAEFNERTFFTIEQVLQTLEEGFTVADNTLAHLASDQWDDVVQVMGKPVKVYEMVFNTVTHYGEHVGQIIYIAKMRTGTSFAALSMKHKKI